MSAQKPQPNQPDLPVSSFFPLYEILLNQVNILSNRDVQLTEDEIRSLITKISSLDKTGSDMIYIWIRLHSLRNSHSKLLDTPYEGEKLDSKMKENDIVCDVAFDIRKFPPILNRMLLRFTDLHIRKMNEDSNRINL